MANQIGMGVCKIWVWDSEAWASIDGLRPPRDAFLAYVPLFLDGAVEVTREGKPFCRVELADRVAGPVLNLSAKIVAVMAAGLKTHGPYTPCTNAVGYARRKAAAAEWLGSVPLPATSPLASWGGRDVFAPFARGVLEKLMGSYSLADDDAINMVEQAFALNRANLVKTAAIVSKGGTWPIDLDGQLLDEQARAEAERVRVAQEARERNAREAAKIIDVVVGDEGIEGFRCRVGCMPSFAHLQTTRAAVGGGPQYRPPSLVQGGWQYWLRRQIPGEPLPEIALPDGSGTIPRDTVLRMTRGQLATVVDGCWQDVFPVREMREQYGVIDRRAIRDDEWVGEADQRWPVVSEQADKLIAEHRMALATPRGGPQRLHVVSSLVRGYLIRPELAAAKIQVAIAPSAPLPGDPLLVRRELAGTYNTMSPHVVEDDAPTAPAPIPSWVEEAVVAAAEGQAFWSHTSPGSLLPALEPTFLQRAAEAIGLRQDEWEPVLRAALRGRDGDRLRSEDLCKIVGADISKKNETGRIKKIMERLGWSKSEFEDESGRYRAYSRAS